jgi:hypothetical protein
MFRANPTDDEILEKFLTLVAFGNQDQAEKLLKINHGKTDKLLLDVNEFTDYSGRTFRCTAYEYAYWAKDMHMCRMLEKYMDGTIKALILDRINAMESIDATGQAKGLTYQQDGKTYHTAHFDFTPLKQALQSYVKACSRWCCARLYGTDNFDVKKAAWEHVCKVQRDVPAHVIEEYYRFDRSFYPCPQFNEPTLPRSDKADSLFMHSNCAAVRGNRSKVELVFHHQLPNAGAIKMDLTAIAYLDKVRTSELVGCAGRLAAAIPLNSNSSGH